MFHQFSDAYKVRSQLKGFVTVPEGVDTELVDEILAAAEATVNPRTWTKHRKAIGLRISSMIKNQTGVWIEPEYTDADRTTGWWKWVTDLGLGK